MAARNARAAASTACRRFGTAARAAAAAAQPRWRGARSRNLAVWRADLERVDGFDADYSGWGKEDSDIIVRLLHAGVRRKDGVFATGVLHLWHPQADRAQLSANERRLSQSLADDRVRARRGLSALQATAAG